MCLEGGGAHHGEGHYNCRFIVSGRHDAMLCSRFVPACPLTYLPTSGVHVEDIFHGITSYGLCGITGYEVSNCQIPSPR